MISCCRCMVVWWPHWGSHQKAQLRVSPGRLPWQGWPHRGFPGLRTWCWPWMLQVFTMETIPSHGAMARGTTFFWRPRCRRLEKSCSEYTLLKLRAGLLYYFNFAPFSNWTFLCWGSVGANWQVPDLKEANGYDTFFSVGKRVPFVHSIWVCLKMGILAGKVTNHQNFRCPVFRINQFPKCFFSLSCDC
jgi:hypothetical protein